MTRARSLTLIEVVVSLALMGSAITALLTAQGRLLRRAQDARQLERATDLAQSLLVHWRLDPVAARQQHEGLFESDSAWRWRREQRLWSFSQRLALDEVRLSVLPRSGDMPVLSWTWLERRDD